MQHSKDLKVNIFRILCGYPPALGLYAIRYFIFAYTHVAIDYLIMLVAGAYLTLVVPFLFTKVKLLGKT